MCVEVIVCNVTVVFLDTVYNHAPFGVIYHPFGKT